MRDTVSIIGDSLVTHFSARLAYLDMLMRLGTTAEEWFRIEILALLTSHPEIIIDGTNRQDSERDRPDFLLTLRGQQRSIELKVLPRDRNYGYGWQRFLAGKNNRTDFERLATRQRSGIVYVYWPSSTDWAACKRHLLNTYHVDCVREDRIKVGEREVVFSYWGAPVPAEEVTPPSGPGAG
jgi:hypothetical protein